MFSASGRREKGMPDLKNFFYVVLFFHDIRGSIKGDEKHG
jgi:hypothetical protein